MGGCSRTGKSTLAHAIASHFTTGGTTARVLDIDRWLVSIDRRTAASTVLARYDCEAIVESVGGLMRGQTVHPPVYDLVSRRRIADRSAEGISLDEGLLIVEGVVALAITALVQSATARIYTQIDDPLRLARLRDFYVNTKGLSTAEAESTIQARELEEVPFIKSTIAEADFVYRL